MSTEWQRAGTLVDLGPSALEGALALATISDLKTQSCVNMVLALLSVIYISVNIICIVLNTYELEDTKDPVTSPEVFHMYEFWGTFCFNVVDVFALIYSPKRLSTITFSPTLLKLIIFVNVAGSFTSASLITINLEAFEIVAHELEYFNELTVSLFDIFLLGSLVRGMSGEKLREQKVSLLGSVATIGTALMIAIVQMSIYNGMGFTDGEANGEKVAHYFEFVFQIISASITFWFTMDNKLVADGKLAKVFKSVGDNGFMTDCSEQEDNASDADSGMLES